MRAGDEGGREGGGGALVLAGIREGEGEGLQC